ncbi:TIGR02444 family protein [Halomonas sp. BM-2019]|uniref:TIGR02444 family protein n=1 Tax=Halomonas sp. BM-2019 TaxID=2811227 RepID=UPI001B3C2794|nr:MAG: TIGR02444 family protein [Halomonas sp. BM-2019]
MKGDSTEMAAVLRARLLDDPLWDFALALYARPGVEAACLALQDEAGVDVCELLWRCWLLHHGARPGPSAEAGLAAVRCWQAEVTVPLRALRRRLKPEAATHSGIASLREALKHAELEAERETLGRLEALALEASPTALSPFHEGAEKALVNALKLQKKRDISTLQPLTRLLDPPPEPD